MSDNRLIEQVTEALIAEGKDPHKLQADDLVAIDQFHLRGKKASLELTELLRESLSAEAGAAEPLRILDLGAGIGGTSRMLARQLDARVEALELSADYVALGEHLTGLLGQSEQVRFSRADASAPPFADQSFDAVCLQHLSMCIEDKARLFGEIARVLKPGGVLVLQEVTAGSVDPALYPTPWADRIEQSFLTSQQVMLEQLQSAGLELVSSTDLSEPARQWFERQSQQRQQAAQPPRLSLKLLLGEGFAAMMANQRRNFNEHRIGLLQACLRRPC